MDGCIHLRMALAGLEQARHQLLDVVAGKTRVDRGLMDREGAMPLIPTLATRKS